MIHVPCYMMHVQYFAQFLARLQTWRTLFSSEFVCLSVCLSVCLWLALLPFNVDRFWWNLVTRTLLWSSLAATIMVQIGRRGTARCLFENFKKFSKITEFVFQNSCQSFLASVSPVYCTKIGLDSNKTDGVCPIVIPAMALLQQHDARRDILNEPAARRRAPIKARVIPNWGHSNWGRNRARKNQPACSF